MALLRKARCLLGTCNRPLDRSWRSISCTLDDIRNLEVCVIGKAQHIFCLEKADHSHILEGKVSLRERVEK